MEYSPVDWIICASFWEADADACAEPPAPMLTPHPLTQPMPVSVRSAAGATPLVS